MIEQGGETVCFNPPSRKLMTEWVVNSLNNLPKEMIKRSWWHSPFSYFEESTATNEEEVGPLHDEINVVNAAAI